MSERVYTAAFLFCGIGGGALGFLKARMKTLGVEARFRSLGGIDNDPVSCAEFAKLTKSPALCADIAKMTPEELRAFLGPTGPDIIFASPPCRGFSGLLSQKKSKSPKYQAMNELVIKGIELILAAWPDSPARLVLLENVPRVASRGKGLLRRARSLLSQAGYVSHGSSHDAGELGGLAQHRRRYLLVARHQKTVPSLLYEPIKKRVRACGEVLNELPMPGDESAGPMHELPKISWLNWVRLALIPAGGDWRDLPGVLVQGQPRRAVHRRHHVADWTVPVATIAGSGTNGVNNVCDPRDPFVDGDARTPRWFKTVLGVVPWNEHAPTVTGESWPQNGRFSVADPRINGKPYDHGYGVLHPAEPSPVVASKSSVGCGAYAYADARLNCKPRSGAYGLLDWKDAAATITGSACIDNGRFAIADIREPANPVLVTTIEDVRKPPSVVIVIKAEDGTWHRPLTTLELAALQGLPTVIDGEPLVLAMKDGKVRHSIARSLIGNMVPPPAAEAIARQMLACLMAADAEAFALSSGGSVWVEPKEGTKLVEEKSNV